MGEISWEREFFTGEVSKRNSLKGEYPDQNFRGGEIFTKTYSWLMTRELFGVGVQIPWRITSLYV